MKINVMSTVLCLALAFTASASLQANNVQQMDDTSKALLAAFKEIKIKAIAPQSINDLCSIRLDTKNKKLNLSAFEIENFVFLTVEYRDKDGNIAATFKVGGPIMGVKQAPEAFFEKNKKTDGVIYLYSTTDHFFGSLRAAISQYGIENIEGISVQYAFRGIFDLEDLPNSNEIVYYSEPIEISRTYLEKLFSEHSDNWLK